jgi:TetR/AcrR family transcriptional repressor of nem operon
MARHSRQEAAETRTRILGLASRAIRARGIDGTAIPALMRDAGLTHGSFYAHFASKDALVQEACAHAFQRSASVQEATAAAAGEGAALVEIVRRYLTELHRDAPGTGCPVPALMADVAHRPAAVRRAFTRGVEDLLARFERLAPVRAAGVAPALLAGIAGAISLSRAVDDPALSARILRDALAFWTRVLGGARGRSRR